MVGRNDAAQIGRYLVANQLTPQKVQYSAARRVVETVEGMQLAFDPRPVLQESRNLYQASASDMIGCLRRTQDDIETLAFVGHSPGIPTLALSLAGPNSDLDALARLTIEYRLGAVTTIRFGVESWNDISQTSSTIERYVPTTEMVEAPSVVVATA